MHVNSLYIRTHYCGLSFTYIVPQIYNPNKVRTLHVLYIVLQYSQSIARILKAWAVATGGGAVAPPQ
jgi:hypothetical protein